MTSLGSTSATAEYLAEKLQEGNETKIELKDAQVSVIGEEGFMSNIFKVTFNWAQEECDLPSSAVVKIPTAGKVNNAVETIGLGEEELKFYNENVGGDKNRDFVVTSHQTEIRVYDFLGPEPPISVPKIYFAQPMDLEAKQDGILMMEDFSDTASYVKLEDSLTLEQVLAVAEQLASLHAFSLKLPSGWDKPFMDNGKERMKMMQGFMTHMINISLALGRLYPERFGDLIKALEPEFQLMSFFKAFMSPMWLGLPKVFVHGDMWTCNLLWAKDDAGGLTSELLSIIDVQSGHPGNLAEDIARLLATSVSAELRRRHLDTILGHYHKMLCEKLGYEPYSLDQVHRAYKAVQPVTVMFMNFALPIFLNAKTISGEGDAKKLANEKVLDRAEECLKDFRKNQETFSLTLGEKMKWYPLQMIVWFAFKFFI